MKTFLDIANPVTQVVDERSGLGPVIVIAAVVIIIATVLIIRNIKKNKKNDRQ